ncbi:MAG: DUF427 domain-containing protein [Pseudomonadota bacterium]
MSRKRLEPGPAHPITIDRVSARACVDVDVARLIDAPSYLQLREANYPPVAYMARAHCDMDHLVRSERTSWCPYKGEASYFHIKRASGDLIEDAIWTYEDPFPAVAAIKGHLAVYPERVDDLQLG